MKKDKRLRKKSAAAETASALRGFSRAAPALERAQRITEKASLLGFDWPDPEPVWRKVAEEWNELKNAVDGGDSRNTEEEMGDLLFSLVNLCRFLGLEAEEALSRSTKRFLKRFRHIEKSLDKRGKNWGEVSLAEMDALWEEAKKMELKK